jgi:hypothetical protein
LPHYWIRAAEAATEGDGTLRNNVIVAAIGALAIVFFLSWETIGLSGAYDLVADGGPMPDAVAAWIRSGYYFLKDWQTLIAGACALWAARALVKATGVTTRPPVESAVSNPRIVLDQNPLKDAELLREQLTRDSATRRLDAALRQLESVLVSTRQEITNSVQQSFMAFQVKSLLSLPSPGLESLHQDIGTLDAEVIYLFYCLLSKLETVRAINIECTRKHVIAVTEEVETVMGRLRDAVAQFAPDERRGQPLKFQTVEPRRRARLGTT